jgi:hypothetical protein
MGIIAFEVSVSLQVVPVSNLCPRRERAIALRYVRKVIPSLDTRDSTKANGGSHA